MSSKISAAPNHSTLRGGGTTGGGGMLIPPAPIPHHLPSINTTIAALGGDGNVTTARPPSSSSRPPTPNRKAVVGGGKEGNGVLAGTIRRGNSASLAPVVPLHAKENDTNRLGDGGGGGGGVMVGTIRRSQSVGKGGTLAKDNASANNNVLGGGGGAAASNIIATLSRKALPLDFAAAKKNSLANNSHSNAKLGNGGVATANVAGRADDDDDVSNHAGNATPNLPNAPLGLQRTLMVQRRRQNELRQQIEKIRAQQQQQASGDDDEAVGDETAGDLHNDDGDSHHISKLRDRLAADVAAANADGGKTKTTLRLSKKQGGGGHATAISIGSASYNRDTAAPSPLAPQKDGGRIEDDGIDENGVRKFYQGKPIPAVAIVKSSATSHDLTSAPKRGETLKNGTLDRKNDKNGGTEDEEEDEDQVRIGGYDTTKSTLGGLRPSNQSAKVSLLRSDSRNDRMGVPQASADYSTALSSMTGTQTPPTPSNNDDDGGNKIISGSHSNHIKNTNAKVRNPSPPQSTVTSNTAKLLQASKTNGNTNTAAGATSSKPASRRGSDFRQHNNNNKNTNNNDGDGSGGDSDADHLEGRYGGGSTGSPNASPPPPTPPASTLAPTPPPQLQMTPSDLAKANKPNPRTAHQAHILAAVRGGSGGGGDVDTPTTTTNTATATEGGPSPTSFANSVNTVFSNATTPPAAHFDSTSTPSAFVTPRPVIVGEYPNANERSRKSSLASASVTPPGSAGRRSRPRSAHQDFEKLVRAATGGAYLKEKYSDHIKIYTHTPLGKGSYGTVYTGINEKNGQMVAVKVTEIDAQKIDLRPTSANDNTPNGAKSRPVSATPSHKQLLKDSSHLDECLKEVVSEIRLMAQLKHPNILQYYHAEVVGQRWEEIKERRHAYLVQQRRRVQQYERRMMRSNNNKMGEGGGAMSPLSPVLLKEEEQQKALPPLEPPHADLTMPPSATGRRFLIIYMEYMSGKSLGDVMKNMLGDKLTRLHEEALEKQNRELKEQQLRDEAAGIPPPTRKPKVPPIVIPPRVIGMTEDLVRVYFRQVISGLAYLHENHIVHRDIKADNILLNASEGVVRISDFGTSRKFSDVSAATSGESDDDGGGNKLMTVIGTPHFMAPEVITKSGHGCPADIWSIGITMMHLLSGQAPYELSKGNAFNIMFKIAENPEKIQEFIPEDASLLAKDFMLKCVAPDPHDRPTARQLLSHPFLSEELDEEGYYSSEEEEDDSGEEYEAV